MGNPGAYETLVCVDSPVFVFRGLAEVASAYVLSQKRQSFVYSPYTITNLEKS